MLGKQLYMCGTSNLVECRDVEEEQRELANSDVLKVVIVILFTTLRTSEFANSLCFVIVGLKF